MSALPLFNFPASPCQRLESRFFADLEVWIKRDDLLHQQVSGNKFRKLKYPLQALAGRSPCMVTMGGPWSNHLHATAHAAALLGWRTIGLVRGAPEMQSATLDDCRQLGMHIVCVTREEYRQLRQPDDRWRQHLPAPYFAGADYVWLPEGGSSAAALHGVAELVDEAIDQIRFIPDSIVLACVAGAAMSRYLGKIARANPTIISSCGYFTYRVIRVCKISLGHH